MASWFSFGSVRSGRARIEITSGIGLGDPGRSFANDLKKLTGANTLEVSISSNGGDASQALFLINTLKRHNARKIVRIEGLAAGSAALLAMAGDEIEIAENARLVIRNVEGESETLNIGANTKAAEIFAARTKMSVNAVSAMMERESWLDAKEAVDLGFADRVVTAHRKAGAFDLRDFKNVPDECFRAEDITTRAYARFNGKPLADGPRAKTMKGKVK